MKLPVPARFRPADDRAEADETPTKTDTTPEKRETPTKTDEAPTKRKARKKPKAPKRPLYARLLHLRHISPNAWQRAVLGEGSVALAVVLVLADVATAWTLLALPLAVAAIVKAHDLLARLLGRPAVPPPAPTPAAPTSAARPSAARKTPAAKTPAAKTPARKTTAPPPPAPDARTAPPPAEWRRR